MKSKINIFLIAERQLGCYIVEQIMANSMLNLLGVATSFSSIENRWWDGPTPLEICSKNNIPIFNSDNVSDFEAIKNTIIKPHFSIAVLNNTFRFPEFLSWATTAINIHGAPLPEYQGNNCTHFGILNNEKKFGMTAYLTSNERDQGPIIGKTIFDVPAFCSNKKLHKLTLESGKKLVSDILHKILDNDLKIIEPFSVSSAKYYDKMGSREITRPIQDEQIDVIARAFYFPPFEPAYVRTGKQKFYLIPENN